MSDTKVLTRPYVIGPSQISFVVPAETPTAYAGPGDVSSGALFWFGMRAYMSTGVGNNCVDIYDNTTTGTQTFVTSTSGGVDTAAISTFLGGHTGLVTKFWDQTGNAQHFAASSAVAPTYVANAVSGKPACQFISSQTLINTGAISQVNPNSVLWTAQRSSAGRMSMLFANSGNFQFGYGLNSSQNSVFGFGGGGTVAENTTATDGSWHNVMGLLTLTGPGAKMVVDGSAGTAVDPGAGSLVGTNITIGSDGTFPFVGYLTELGIWPSDKTATATSFSTNAHGYYSF